jgi:hypothetical protein
MDTFYLMGTIVLCSALFVGAIVGMTIFLVTKSRSLFMEKIQVALKAIAAEVKGTFYEAGERSRMFSLAFKKEEAREYFRLHPGGFYPALSFPFEGGEGSIYFSTSGSEDTMTYWTAITLSMERPFENSVSVSLGGLFDRFSKILGARDIMVGDAAFDERFEIKGENEDFARNILNAAIRRVIEQLAEVSGDCFEIHMGGNIVIKREGFMEEKEMLRRYILLSIDLGNALAALRVASQEQTERSEMLRSQ